MTQIIDKEALEAELAVAVRGSKTELQAVGAALATASKHIARRTEANFAELRSEILRLRAAPTAEGPTEVVVLSIPRPKWRHVVSRDAFGRIAEIVSEPIDQ